MENLPKLYVLFALLGCILAVVAAWSRRRLLVRVGAVAGLLMMMALSYTALVDLLGRPKPMAHDSLVSIEGDSIVLAASIDEGLAIYLWLRHPGIRQPRYYQLPWEQEAAISLKKALTQSMRNNSTVMMNNPAFEDSLETDKEPLFYVLPPERLPLKPPPEVFEYRNPTSPI